MINNHFIEASKLVREILAAVSSFETASLVRKLKRARDRKSKIAGYRIEGAPRRIDDEVRKLAKKLHRQRLSLRAISGELAAKGHLNQNGEAYGAESIRRLINTPLEFRTIDEAKSKKQPAPTEWR